ncbi:VOC family protein [Rhizorhabdus phycosphaerae]|uniref:VOC family protein n=1 Tax=Rhizorhabdus phycosphaerae TaxID=2711156 RepID=UPI0013EAB1F9|nr:VOC family protein [Rhizorhabdus phycosphaerae]
MMELRYVTVGTNDMEKALAFYADLLATQGATKMFDHPSGGAVFGKEGKPMLGLVRPFDGKDATAGNGTMIAFELESREAVDAFHAKALALGGADEGAPGERGPGFYMSYFRDLDGNKFSACKFG